MKRTTPTGFATLVCCAALGLAALTGCGPKGASDHGAAADSSPAVSSGRPAGSPPATAPAISAPPTGSAGTGTTATTTLDEQADHTTATVKVGTTVRIDLHSTYWSAVTSSAPKLLAPTTAPSVSAASSCRPGGGCGTVTEDFLARAAGSVQLTAQRTSCGEAKPCPPDQRTLTITVDITP